MQSLLLDVNRQILMDSGELGRTCALDPLINSPIKYWKLLKDFNLITILGCTLNSIEENYLNPPNVLYLQLH